MVARARACRSRSPAAGAPLRPDLPLSLRLFTPAERSRCNDQRRPTPLPGARPGDGRLHLNVHTTWGNGDDLPVTAHPAGRFAVIRLPSETRQRLSGTLSF
jgi:hypothetical protein